MFLSKRIPKGEEIASVYAVGVTILYTFTLVAAFHDFSRNWVLYLGVADIAGLFAYMLTGAFIESLLIIAPLLLIGFVLPQKIVRSRFVFYGVVVIVTFLGSLMFRDGTVGISDVLKNAQMVFTAFGVSALVLVGLGEYFAAFRKVVEGIADNCIIFLYIYMPLSVIAIIIVIFRNIG